MTHFVSIAVLPQKTFHIHIHIHHLKYSPEPHCYYLFNAQSAGGSKAVQAAAASNGVNVRIVDDNTVGLAFGEAITRDDCVALLKVCYKHS